VFFAGAARCIPTEAAVTVKWGGGEFILAEETEIIIEGEALAYCSISQGKNIANVKMLQVG